MAVVGVKWSERVARDVGAFLAAPSWEWRAATIVTGGVLLRLGWMKLGTLVFLAGAVRRHHVHAWMRMHSRYRALQRQRKLGLINVVRAARPEVGVTALQREQKWWARCCEVRHITPAPRVTKVVAIKGGRKLTLRLDAAGFTVDSLRKYEQQIAHYLGNQALEVRIANHPNHNSMCFLYVMTEDLLKIPLGDWPLLNEPPKSRSIVNGLLAGKDAGHADITLDVVNDAVFVSGQRGTGKSAWLQQLVAAAALCNDVELWLGDMKEGAEFYLWRGRVHQFCDNPDDALAMIKALVKERERRSRLLQAKGLRKWAPGCGFPFILLVIDEIADVSKPDELAQELLTKLVRLGRAQGIGLILATQHPKADMISTTLRAQCNAAVSYKVRGATENTVALGAGATELGLKAHRLPKYRFIAHGHDDGDGTTGRGWFIEDEQLVTLIAKLLPSWPPPSGPSLESDSNPTVSDLHIEPPPSPESPQSDSLPAAPPAGIDPPPETMKSAKARALWDALPGERAALASASGYHPATASAKLSEWQIAGYTANLNGRWEKRDPADIERAMA